MNHYRSGVGVDDLDAARPPPLLVRRRCRGRGGGGAGRDAAGAAGRLLPWLLRRGLVVGRGAPGSPGATVRVVHPGPRRGAVPVRRGRSRRVRHRVLRRLLVRLGWDPVWRGLALGHLGHGDLEKRKRRRDPLSVLTLYDC